MTLIEAIDKPHTYEPLLNAVKKTGWLEEFFPAFLDAFDKFSYNEKYRSFKFLINSIKTTELLFKFQSQIKTHFIALLNYIERSQNLFQRNSQLNALLKTAEETGWTEEFFVTFLETIDKFPDPDNKNYGFLRFFESTKRMNIDLSQIKNSLVEEQLPLYNEFIQIINSSEPLKMVSIPTGEPPFPLDEYGIKQNMLWNMKNDTGEYAKLVWSNPHLTMKERMDLVGKDFQSLRKLAKEENEKKKSVPKNKKKK